MSDTLASKIRCKFMTCFAGTGVAGNGNCFLGGDPEDPKCPKFKDEEEALREWKEREEGEGK